MTKPDYFMRPLVVLLKYLGLGCSLMTIFGLYVKLRDAQASRRPPGTWLLSGLNAEGIFLYVCGPILIVAVPTGYLWWVEWKLTHRKPRKGFCEKCGHNLTGNTSGICPECGTSTLNSVMETSPSQSLNGQDCE